MIAALAAKLGSMQQDVGDGLGRLEASVTPLEVMALVTLTREAHAARVVAAVRAVVSD